MGGALRRHVLQAGCGNADDCSDGVLLALWLGLKAELWPKGQLSAIVFSLCSVLQLLSLEAAELSLALSVLAVCRATLHCTCRCVRVSWTVEKKADGEQEFVQLAAVLGAW